MNEEQMEYVANLMSQDLEKDKEIQRLNNIIEEIEKDCIEYLNIMNVGIDNGAYYTAISSPIQFIEKELKKIKELKEGKQ